MTWATPFPYEFGALAAVLGFRRYVVPRIRARNARHLGRLEAAGDHKALAMRYRKAADTDRIDTYQEHNFLGLALLYEQEPVQALSQFRAALDGALGPNLAPIRDHVMLALLQCRRYSEAYDLLQRQRARGRVFVLPYMLVMLLAGRQDEARSFFATARAGLAPSHVSAIETLLAFSPEQPESLTPVEALALNPTLWLFQVPLQDLALKFETDVFMTRLDRHERLCADGRLLLLDLAGAPEVFSDPVVRLTHQVLGKILPRWEQGDARAAMFGMLLGMDRIVDNMPLDPELTGRLRTFWAHFYAAYWRSLDPHLYDPARERAFMGQLLPPDAEPVASGLTGSWSYYRHPPSGLGLCWYPNVPNPVPRVFTVLLPELAESLHQNLLPLVEMMSAYPSLRPALEPLAERAVRGEEPVGPARLRDVGASVEPPLREPLEALITRYQGLQEV